MIKVVISGIQGKMGQILKHTLETNTNFCLVGGYDHETSLGVNANLENLPNADVLIDFSHPSALNDILAYALKHKVALVIATTGYTKEELELIENASQNIPIFYSANYSIGIYLLNQALKQIVKPLEKDYDVEIIETHHHFKKDAPSGTALKLANTINEELLIKKPIIKGESETKGIHIHSLRLGNYVGEHEVIFSSMEETIRLSHTAHDKKVFAVGAIKATEFIVTKAKGLYGMDDLLGGKHE